MGEVEPVEHRAPVGIVPGCALTPHVRRPDRHPIGTPARRITATQQPVHPVQEKPAGVAGPADLALAGKVKVGRVHRPGT